MGLFFKKTKKEIIANPEEIITNKKNYPIHYSNHFKGFKKFAFVVYGNDEAMENNEVLCSKDLSNSTFEFLCQNCKTKYFDGRMALLYLNGIKIGAIFDENELEIIENNQIEKVHLEPGADKRLHLFVKIIE